MPFVSTVDWSTELNSIQKMIDSGSTLVEIGNKYGVSRQRVKQVLQKHGLITKSREIKREIATKSYFSRHGDKSQTDYQIKKIKYSCKKSNAKRVGIEFTIPFGEIIWNEYCPVLGIKLDYNTRGIAADNSPSIDRIDPTKGYISGNTVVMSWKANRLKNDGSAEDHKKIAEWLLTITKNSV